VIRVERGTTSETPQLPPHDQVHATVAAFAQAVRTGSCPGERDSLRQAALLEALAARSTG
jgi:predicted dehydrogenase